MKKENLVLFDCVVGSTAYNLRTENSDTDHRRVVTPTDLSFFFGLNKFDVGNVVTTKEEDNVDYSVGKFIDLAMRCNTVMLEMLFAPKHCVLFSDPLFERYFVDNRYKFLSKNLYHVVKGYAHAEYRRALGETTGTLGTRRKEEVAALGFSPKNASHCIRLLWAASTALTDGEFVVEWNDSKREVLMNLKLGKLPLDLFKLMFEESMNSLENSKERSQLPERIDKEYFNSLMTNFYLHLFGSKLSNLVQHI